MSHTSHGLTAILVALTLGAGASGAAAESCRDLYAQMTAAQRTFGAHSPRYRQIANRYNGWCLSGSSSMPGGSMPGGSMPDWPGGSIGDSRLRLDDHWQTAIPSLRR